METIHSSSGQKSKKTNSDDRNEPLQITHKISSKDTIQGVAVKYGVTVADIMRANKLWRASDMFARKELIIPVKTEEALIQSQTPKDSTRSPKVTTYGIKDSKMEEDNIWSGKKQFNQFHNVKSSKLEEDKRMISRDPEEIWEADVITIPNGVSTPIYRKTGDSGGVAHPVKRRTQERMNQEEAALFDL